MGWWHGIKADVESQSFTTIAEWHRYLVQQDAAADGYRPTASQKRNPGVEAKLEERMPYINAAGSVINWLVYDGPGSDERDVVAAMAHIRKCLGANAP